MTAVAISYSGGASSAWMVHAVIEGLIPRPEHLVVVFADTGWEHPWTYEAVERMVAVCAQAGIPFLVARREHDGVAAPTLVADLLSIPSLPEDSRIDQPPLWLRKGYGRGKARQRCTRAWKIRPMRRVVSAWLREQGLAKWIVKWLGFGADEYIRAGKSMRALDVKWERLDFPAMRLGRTRAQQRAELEVWTGKPAPRFSMCVGCPFKSPKRFRATPAESLDSLYEVDAAVADCSAIGLDYPAHLTDRLVRVERLITRGDPQPDLPGIEAHCDDGHCFL